MITQSLSLNRVEHIIAEDNQQLIKITSFQTIDIAVILRKQPENFVRIFLYVKKFAIMEIAAVVESITTNYSRIASKYEQSGRHIMKLKQFKIK
jgi:hypothetical protein